MIERTEGDLPYIARHADKESLAYKLFFMWLFSMGGFGTLWWSEWLLPEFAWYVDWLIWAGSVLLTVISFLYLLNAEYFDWLEAHES